MNEKISELVELLLLEVHKDGYYHTGWGKKTHEGLVKMIANVLELPDGVMRYSVTTPENWDAYVTEGNENYLNDVNVGELIAGDEVVIAWEGDSKEVTIA